MSRSQTQLAFLLATEAEKLERQARERDGNRGPGGPSERNKPAPHGRNKVPGHLPTERIELLPAEVQCDPDAFEWVGEETRELIERRSASHVRVIVVRRKLVRKDASEAKGVIAEPLAVPIERGLAGPGLVAWVVVSKFCDHLRAPRDRGHRFLGIVIARSTPS